MTNDVKVLGFYGNTGILEASSSNDVLGSSVSVDPISSNGYKTPTKKQRTFAICNFKAVLTKAQYKKLYMVKYFGKYKQSRLLPNVKKCKLVKTSIVYMKYSYYNI